MLVEFRDEVAFDGGCGGEEANEETGVNECCEEEQEAKSLEQVVLQVPEPGTLTDLGAADELSGVQWIAEVGEDLFGGNTGGEAVFTVVEEFAGDVDAFALPEARARDDGFDELRQFERQCVNEGELRSAKSIDGSEGDGLGKAIGEFDGKISQWLIGSDSESGADAEE